LTLDPKPAEQLTAIAKFAIEAMPTTLDGIVAGLCHVYDQFQFCAGRNQKAGTGGSGGTLPP
jgi:hypothetical protein